MNAHFFMNCNLINCTKRFLNTYENFGDGWVGFVALILLCETCIKIKCYKKFSSAIINPN